MPGVGQAQKPVRIEALGPNAPIKWLCEGIVHQDKLRPLVNPDVLRPTILDRDALQCLDYIASAITKPDIERQWQPGVIVDD